MKIAVFSVTLIDYSIHEAMRIAKQIGFDGIEIAGREPHLSSTTSAPRIREIRSVADGLGLEIPAIGAYVGGFSTASDQECQQAYSDFERILEASGVLGSDMIRVSAGGPTAFLAQDYHYAKSAHWLKKCAEAANAQGKKIVLEIHNNSLVETVESGLRLVGMVGADNMGLIHDAGNMYITDTDYGRESVIQLGNKMFHVHVKDEKRIAEAGGPGTFSNLTKHGTEKFMQCLLGEGAADHQPLFDALKETGYSGWLSLECFAPLPAYERLEHDFNKVKQMLGRARVQSTFETAK
ncbi:sugar phosphate isomerase/epimerase family protein [Paenibacillus ginsengarvi]|uniref:Sugar phosphate isomerase/epimerase n=1 Tax=Paenibacillus ginsengarvi TaxID=400777 RepID=A0A3B0C2U7_9BACL|nr:sugar phosphate isomerase/epimerase family protein [Paenibacillus ginsengarvi]RKN80535.1 sugar phosphate isomerase/epimerase [Paenibacillus ginsengarvi]